MLLSVLAQNPSIPEDEVHYEHLVEKAYGHTLRIIWLAVLVPFAFGPFVFFCMNAGFQLNAALLWQIPVGIAGLIYPIRVIALLTREIRECRFWLNEARTEKERVMSKREQTPRKRARHKK